MYTGEWIDDELATYTNWNKGEPNGGTHGEGYYCSCLFVAFVLSRFLYFFSTPSLSFFLFPMCCCASTNALTRRLAFG